MALATNDREFGVRSCANNRLKSEIAAGPKSANTSGFRTSVWRARDRGWAFWIDVIAIPE
jgi:hypothetical protein